MTWLFVMVVLVYCFTIGFTHKYKEAALEEREKRLMQKSDFDVEIGAMLSENAALREQLQGKL